LTWDPPEKWLMENPPRDVKQHIFNRETIIDWLQFGLLMWWIAFTNYILYFLFHGLWLLWIDATWISYMTATTVTYTSIVFCQYANIFSIRTWDQSIFTPYIRSNKKLLWAFLISFAWVLTLVYMPVVHDYFGFSPMGLMDWLLPISGWLVFLFVREMKKYFKRKRYNKNDGEVIETIQTELK
jgi:Ca2+-transporting ATPase